MGRVAASVLDTLAVALVGFAAFRLAVGVAPCSDQAECIPLTPIVVLAALIAVALYFWLAHRLWGMTLGQRIFKGSRSLR
jgi:hypothetical protein